MKKTVMIMMIGALQFSLAGSTLMQKVEQDQECKSALIKDYKTASKRELQCKTMHSLAKKLEKSSYRSIDRIIDLKKAQRVVKSMKNGEKIHWILKQNEIAKNHDNLLPLVWPKANLLYFDVEVKNGQIVFMYATNIDNTISISKKSHKFNSKEVGKSVQVCTKDNKCVEINQNRVVLPYGLTFDRFKVLTPRGSFVQPFKSIPYTHLVTTAYEINAQLFNQSLPPLKSVRVSVQAPPAPKPSEKVTELEHQENSIVTGK